METKLGKKIQETLEHGEELILNLKKCCEELEQLADMLRRKETGEEKPPAP